MTASICEVLLSVRDFVNGFKISPDWLIWGERTLELDFPHPVHDFATMLMHEPDAFGREGPPPRTLGLVEAEGELEAFFAGLPEFPLPVSSDGVVVCGTISLPPEVVYLVWRACRKHR
jgi:hypothetical protein